MYQYEDVCAAKFRYARALDFRDSGAYRDVLADELDVDFSWLRGEPRRTSAEQWVSDARALIDAFAGTQHVITNVVANPLADEVLLTSYVHATHVFQDQGVPDRVYVVGGAYKDRLRRIGNDWRFSSITMHVLWTSGDATVMSDAVRRTRAAAGTADA